jgi:hypothetical protein
MKFTNNYYKNLSLLLKSGYSVKQANSIASKITQKIRKEEKEKFQQDVKKQVVSILKQ